VAARPPADLPAKGEGPLLSRRPLPRRFFERDASEVAPDLLGRLLIREADGTRLSGRIVEAEAYGRGDPGSHAFRGPTRGNASMFGPPGRAYVYISHGIHHCLNVVCLAPTAVLIRAIEPLEGVEAMARRRGLDVPRLLCAGPGRLCQALGITLAEDGAPLTRATGLWLAVGDPAGEVAVTPRVGMSDAVNRPWRFVVPGSPFASRPVRATLPR
jgi:DNA-3-methyladenine glycosylase